ncbi:DUF3466 family protein [Psychromonas sp. PT13]|uniref:DUF3466 family protein n=1 Tax=Psychromonas sp. PT13 TaxID=3439547 RepID=UPI003EB93538
MRFRIAITSLSLVMATSSWASTDPYFSVEEINVEATDANYGPYPSAISDDGSLIGTYSMKSLLSRDIDMGLPFTFNRGCQYADVFCDLEFYGSEDTDALSYENAYQAWRNALADAPDDDYSSYMMANVINTSDTGDVDSTTTDSDTGIDTTTYDNDNTSILPYDEGDYDTDVKVTDVMGDNGDDQFVVGFSTDAYSYSSDDSEYQRDFVRRAFIKYSDSDYVTSLLPDFYEDTDDDDADDANGGLSSAYKVKEVTIDDYTTTLVVGASSISYPEDDDDDDVQDYYNYCYGFDDYDDDEEGTLNNLVYCSGFDTQAWAWEIIDSSSNVNVSSTADVELTGFELASEWLDDNEDNDDSNITYSASALDINASGIAVGVSTFEKSSSATGGRQRAIIMTPYFDDNGDDSYDTSDNVYADESGTVYSGGDIYYGVPVELTDAVDDVDDDDGDTIYNSWALAITDGDDDDVMVIGNREYSAAKSVNKPTEFFVYDLDTEEIDFPLKNKKVLTTEQKNDGDSSSKTGANSRAYDINESGFIVGKADDYDQTHPVTGGMPRTQSAFLYDNGTDSSDNDESWFINDLICTEDDDGVVTSPLYKIRSARVISDADADGQYYVLAEGWKYDTDDDYQDEVNATEVMLKLTRNTSVSSPDDSPNCWDSDLLNTDDDDDSYERSGGASFWLWIFALPLLLVRRFNK